MTVEEPNKSSNNYGFLNHYRIYMTYFSLCILVFMSGMNMSWTSPILKKLNHTEDNPVGRPLTIDESSWLSSISILGSVVGCLICGSLGKLMGRKPLITSMGVPYLMFSLIMAFSKEPWLYILARLLSGITAGSVLGICPIYFAEIAEPEQRGRLFIFISIASNLGYLYALCVGPYVSFFWFHISIAIFPIVFLILFPTIAYESPYSVLRRDPAKGEELLKKIRCKKDISEEMQRIQDSFQECREVSVVELFKSKATRRALFIAMSLGIFVMLSGNMTILSYTQFIFEKSGSVWSAEANTIILSAFQLLTAVASSPFGDRFGRRIILSTAFTVAALSEVVLGIYLVLVDNGTKMDGILKWLPLIFLMIYVTASSFIGIAPSLSGELFSPEAKDISISLVVMAACLSGFGTTFLFQRLQKAIGLGETFFIFACTSLSLGVFTIVFLVETRGKTLEEIQDELNNNSIVVLKNRGRK